MRCSRRGLLGFGLVGAAGLYGCARQSEPDPKPTPKPAGSGSFAFVAQNMGGGHRDDGTGSGRVAVVRGAEVSVHPYEPIDQARVLCDGKGFVWMTIESVWRWEQEPQQVAKLPVPGSCDGLHLQPDGSIVAAVNGGSPDGKGYATGLVVMDGATSAEWVHSGWVGGRVCRQAGRVYAVATNGPLDAEARLVSTESGGHKDLTKPISHELWWGSLVAVGRGRVAAIQTTPQRDAAALWTYDVVAGTEQLTQLKGAVPIADWYTGEVPSALLPSDDGLLFFQGRRTWRIDVADGRVTDLFAIPAEDDVSVELTSFGLVRYWKRRGRYHADVRDLHTGKVKDGVEGVQIDGPSDMIPWGAAYLP